MIEQVSQLASRCYNVISGTQPSPSWALLHIHAHTYAHLLLPHCKHGLHRRRVSSALMFSGLPQTEKQTSSTITEWRKGVQQVFLTLAIRQIWRVFLASWLHPSHSSHRHADTWLREHKVAGVCQHAIIIIIIICFMMLMFFCWTSLGVADGWVWGGWCFLKYKNHMLETPLSLMNHLYVVFLLLRTWRYLVW